VTAARPRRGLPEALARGAMGRGAERLARLGGSGGREESGSYAL
jgi:hypothetical protein